MNARKITMSRAGDRPLLKVRMEHHTPDWTLSSRVIEQRRPRDVFKVLVLIVALVGIATSTSAHEASPEDAHGRIGPNEKPLVVNQVVTEFSMAVPATRQERAVSVPKSLPTTAYSAQLHVHGSFSEGPGSVESSVAEAENIALDVIWWSDHDGNYTHHHTTTTFGFEDISEPRYMGEPWFPAQEREMGQVKVIQPVENSGMDIALADLSSQHVRSGESSFRMEGLSSDPTVWGRFYWGLEMLKGRMRRSLATGLKLGIAIYPEALGPDGSIGLNVDLSLHGPIPEAGRIHYYLNSDPTATPSREGSVYSVPLLYEMDQWNVYSIDVTQDAIEGFPEHDALDNSFRTCEFGVESRGGSQVIAYFDDLSWPPETGYPESFQIHRDIMDRAQSEVPAVRQLQGVEISEERHMNEFTVDTQAPDYDQIAIDGGFMDELGWIEDSAGWIEYLAEYLVDSAHSRDGLVSLNHPLVSSRQTPVENLERMVENRLFGADLLEVGYRLRGDYTLAERLWVWDELAKEGIRVLGVGVSDSHSDHFGSTARETNNFITWIYADSMEKADLIDGMRRGRMYFGDLTRFDGTVELETKDGFRMGQIVLTDEAEESVTVDISGLEVGDEIRTIHSGDPGNTYIASESNFSVTESISLTDGAFHRVEVYRSDGFEKAFSNPIHFISRIPDEGVDGFRAGLRQDGIVSTSIESFTLTSVDSRSRGSDTVLTIGGFGDAGSITLDVSAAGVPAAVQFRDLGGSWSYESGILTISDLEGEGLVRITLSSAAAGG